MCGKTPTGIKTGYTIGIGNDWYPNIPSKVYPSEERHETPVKETVNHPDHYNSKGIEVMDVIRAFDLSFSLGNVIKYVLRAGKKHKETYLEDLKKAKWYLDEEISHVEPIPQGRLGNG